MVVMKKVFASVTRILVWAPITVLLISCSEINSLSGQTSNVEALKDIFISPLIDSVIEVESTISTSSVTSKSADNSHGSARQFSLVSPYTEVASGIGADANIRSFGLSKSDLHSCESYLALDQSENSRFANLASVESLADGFAWSSNAQIPISYAGEFGYISSFEHSCALKSALSNIDQSIDITALTEADKTFVISNTPGDYVKATLSINDMLMRGRQLQQTGIFKSSIATFDAQAPEEHDRLQFFRVLQNVALNQGGVDNLRMSVVHKVVLDKAKSQLSPLTISELSSENNDGELVMQQRFSVVVSNSSEQWQGIGFFASYKYDDRCQAYKTTEGKTDYSRYQLETSSSSNKLVCKDSRQNEIAFSDITTDTALYVAIVDKRYGSYVNRVICQGGHKNDEGYYDISSCLATNVSEQIRYYDTDGKPVDASSDDGEEMSKKLSDNIRVVRSQMYDFSINKLLPSQIDTFAQLQGNFDASTNPVDTDTLASREYASEQQTTDLAIPVNVSVRAYKDLLPITIGWSVIDGATYYKIYRATGNEVSTAIKVYETEEATTTHFDDSNYLPEEFFLHLPSSEYVYSSLTYYYWIKACNIEGCSKDFSAAATIDTDSFVPATPKNLKMMAKETIKGLELSLKWDTAQNASTYRITKALDQVGNIFLNGSALEVEPTDTDHTIDAAGNPAGFYWVQGCDKNFCSPPSKVADYESSSGGPILTPPVAGAPDVPKNVRVLSDSTSDSERYTTLVWKASAGATHYRVWHNPRFAFNHSGTTMITDPLVEVPRLDISHLNSKQHYWVQACIAVEDEFNCSDRSEPSYAISDISDISDELLPLYAASSVATTVVPDAPVIVTAEINSGNFAVSTGVCNSETCQEQSLAVAEITTPDIPQQMIAATSGRNIRLSWDNVASAQNYHIYRNLSNNQETANFILAVSALDATEYIDSPPVVGTTYYYWVLACKNGICSKPASPASATSLYYPLNDSGIEGSLDITTGNYSATDCLGVDQDCHQGRDYRASTSGLNKLATGTAGFDFTRLDAQGNVHQGDSDFANNPWQCVRDNRTGLVWEVKQTQASNSRLKHLDEFTERLLLSDKKYGWGENSATLSVENWTALVDAANSANLCDYSDWRVPNLNELISIVDFDAMPRIDTSYFPNIYVDEAIFWTSQIKTKDAKKAWLFDFAEGNFIDREYQSTSALVRMVRGDVPVPNKDVSLVLQSRQIFNDEIANDWSVTRYINHGNGTITDRYTGLMWMQCPVGQNRCNYINSAKLNWATALSTVSSLNFATYSDWRLPNIKELQSLVAFNRYATSVNTTLFPWITSIELWSSTPATTDNDVFGYDMENATPERFATDDEHRAVAVRNAIPEK